MMTTASNIVPYRDDDSYREEPSGLSHICYFASFADAIVPLENMHIPGWHAQQYVLHVGDVVISLTY